MAHPPPVAWLHHVAVHAVSPMVLLAVAAGFVWLCWNGRWKADQPGDPPEPPAPETGGLLSSAAA
jgi:hypothetical protein